MEDERWRNRRVQGDSLANTFLLLASPTCGEREATRGKGGRSPRPKDPRSNVGKERREDWQAKALEDRPVCPVYISPCTTIRYLENNNDMDWLASTFPSTNEYGKRPSPGVTTTRSIPPQTAAPGSPDLAHRATRRTARVSRDDDGQPKRWGIARSGHGRRYRLSTCAEDQQHGIEGGHSSLFHPQEVCSLISVVSIGSKHS